jgi:hypothetical protein
MCGKPLKRFSRRRRCHTQLKQGVNENGFNLRPRRYEFCEFKTSLLRIPLAFALLVAGFLWSPAHSAPDASGDARSRFLQLCDRAITEIPAGNRKDPFFVDSYAVRALCVAYDMTGKKEYLNDCREWSGRMVAFQGNMVPAGAYYMNYGRKPGEEKGSWYVADSSSIAMGVLATAVRCKGIEKQRFLNSAKSFASQVMANYVGPAGGIRNGFWPKFDGEWWCSSGIFGSLSFLLYNETGDERYLKSGLGVVDWLNRFDLAQAEPYPLSEMGPTLPMYVLEAYSAGLPHLKPGSDTSKLALTRISSALDWTAGQQCKPPGDRQWAAEVKWGMKFGGLPFHQYVYSRVLPEGARLSAVADHEMDQLASVVFTGKVKFTQLPVFMMMSYAERLAPGAIYKSSKGVSTETQRGRPQPKPD